MRNAVDAWIIAALVVGVIIVLILLIVLLRTAFKHEESTEWLHEARALTRLPEHVSTDLWYEAAQRSQSASYRRRKK